MLGWQRRIHRGQLNELEASLGQRETLSQTASKHVLNQSVYRHVYACCLVVICILSLHLLLQPHPPPVSFLLWLGLRWPSQASNLPSYLCRYSRCVSWHLQRSRTVSCSSALPPYIAPTSRCHVSQSFQDKHSDISWHANIRRKFYRSPARSRAVSGRGLPKEGESISSRGWAP